MQFLGNGTTRQKNQAIKALTLAGEQAQEIDTVLMFDTQYVSNGAATGLGLHTHGTKEIWVAGKSGDVGYVTLHELGHRLYGESEILADAYAILLLGRTRKTI